MSKLILAGSLVAMSMAHSGYRRAGLIFTPGENVFPDINLSEEQFRQLATDPRLRVSLTDADDNQLVLADDGELKWLKVTAESIAPEKAKPRAKDKDADGTAAPAAAPASTAGTTAGQSTQAAAPAPNTSAAPTAAAPADVAKPGAAEAKTEKAPKEKPAKAK